MWGCAGADVDSLAASFFAFGPLPGSNSQVNYWLLMSLVLALSVPYGSNSRRSPSDWMSLVLLLSVPFGSNSQRCPDDWCPAVRLHSKFVNDDTSGPLSGGRRYALVPRHEDIGHSAMRKVFARNQSSVATKVFAGAHWLASHPSVPPTTSWWTFGLALR
jgi:hypothetical protein